MTTAVLATIAAIAAVTLLGVLWSIVGQIRAESANARLRGEGVHATGTVVDNTITSTAQRRLLFSPVVEFRTMSGQPVLAAAQQTAASSWPRGTTVEVAYDPSQPSRFVLAGRPDPGHLVANVIVGLLIIAVMVGSMLAMYLIWREFRYDQDAPPAQSQGQARTVTDAPG